MSRLTQDGTAEPVSRDQILRRERGQRSIHFSCSPDHVQDWQPYPVDPYSCYMCPINTYQVLLTIKGAISTLCFGDGTSKGPRTSTDTPRVEPCLKSSTTTIIVEYCCTSHHITSHHITSHHITSHHLI